MDRSVMDNSYAFDMMGMCSRELRVDLLVCYSGLFSFLTIEGDSVALAGVYSEEFFVVFRVAWIFSRGASLFLSLSRFTSNCIHGCCSIFSKLMRSFGL